MNKEAPRKRLDKLIDEQVERLEEYVNAWFTDDGVCADEQLEEIAMEFTDLDPDEDEAFDALMRKVDEIGCVILNRLAVRLITRVGPKVEL